jgi:hypothetical protein
MMPRIEMDIEMYIEIVINVPYTTTSCMLNF